MSHTFLTLGTMARVPYCWDNSMCRWTLCCSMSVDWGSVWHRADLLAHTDCCNSRIHLAFTAVFGVAVSADSNPVDFRTMCYAMLTPAG